MPMDYLTNPPSRALIVALATLSGMTLVGCGESEKATDVETTETIDIRPDTAPDTAETAVDTTEDVGPDSDGDEPKACKPLNVSGELVANDVSGVFTLGGEVDLGLGGSEADVIIFELYSDEMGTFALGTGANENYGNCDQCVRILEDVDLDNGKQPTQYYPTAGSITIEPTAAGGRNVRITLEDLEMVEVTIRAADFVSTPVPNGECYVRSARLVLETAACVPECGDHICGDDGCGGACGSGCEGTQVCSIDGLRCETSRTVCQQVILEGTLANPAAGVYRLPLTPLGLGSVGASDFLQLEFYSDGTGGFSLGGGINRNYSSCDQCVRLVVDGSREFFQREGLLTVEGVSNPIAEPGVDAYVRLVFSGVRLEEVELDDEFVSTPLANGSCIDLVVNGVLTSEEL